MRKLRLASACVGAHGNHFHLLLETPQPNLVSGMKWLLGTFSQGWNCARKRQGHVFQGRYKSVPVNGGDAEVNLTSQPSALVVPSFCKFEVGTASRRLNSRWLMMDGTCRTSHRRRRWPRFGLLDPPLRHFTGKARLHQTEHFNALPASGRCPG